MIGADDTDSSVSESIGSEAVIRQKDGYENKMNLSFCYRLMLLQRVANDIQYRLAYLSTLGDTYDLLIGAYHLCNHPKVALDIAIKQEGVGRFLGSTSVVLKAKVFQAINLALIAHGKEKRPTSGSRKSRINQNLLKRSEKMLEECHRIASDKLQMDESLKSFVQSSQEWLRKQLISMVAEISQPTSAIEFEIVRISSETHGGVDDEIHCSSRVEELQ